ncbi:oxidoreductase [Photorhabdus aegyptia]|uniref:Flagellin modification protein A n=1 Tax=Photorhabdus aegyptia TaxID=2805098 RepID=A0A022PFC1_9GAMM|nr:oxidoreductase [Photorhabdus aegyptia]EYU14229.1 dehydrogenase of unknown specificity [Photorhabdus aegyptia]
MKGFLENKTILIAGAGGLLGSHVVQAALAQEAIVIAADLNINTLSECLIKQGVDVNQTSLKIVELDVTNEHQVKSFFELQDDLTGAVNATYPRNRSYGKHFFDVTLDSFNDNVALHLGSAFVFSQQCAAYFKKNDQEFSLINLASIYGVVAPRFEIYNNTHMTTPVEYAAIKSAILHLNKYIVNYINDSRFRINCVSPGGLFDHQPESFLQAYKNNTHGTGMLNAQDIVGAILFLLSDQSRYITGQNIIVDDGFSL